MNTEVDGLTANADHLFGVWVNQSFEDLEHYVSHLLQGGLGMPDGDDYVDPSPKMSALRAQYQRYIAAILKLADLADSETRAARIMSLEIRIAQAHAPDADAADVFKQNNPWNRADLGARYGLGRLLYSGRNCRTAGIHRLAAVGCDRNFCPSRQ